MLTRCTICSHSQEAAINSRLLAGEPLLPLAREYALRSRDLRHHRDAHVFQRKPRQWVRRAAAGYR
jgi:hypothetical protein